MSKNGVINLHFLTILTQTLQDTIDFCKKIGLLPNVVTCPNCKKMLQKPYFINRSKGDGVEVRYQCNKKICRGRGKRNQISLKTDTWFGGSKVTLKKSSFLTYCFVHQMPYDASIHETSIDLVGDIENLENQKQLTTSRKTVCDYKRYCCEICMNIVLDNSSEMIGGEGKIVEIDKSKFGKCKYNKGRLVEGQWVLGGICREDKEIFLIPVASHDKETLIPLLIERIRPGSIIYSDCWKSYDWTNMISLI